MERSNTENKFSFFFFPFKMHTDLQAMSLIKKYEDSRSGFPNSRRDFLPISQVVTIRVAFSPSVWDSDPCESVRQ